MRTATRRSLCRLGFLGLCVVPTLLVCCWAVAVQSPGYGDMRRAAWAALLHRQLGVGATVGGIDHPSWAVTRLWDVKLHDPETQLPIGGIRAIEISHQGGELLIRVSQPELLGTQANRLWSSIYDRLLRGGTDFSLPVRVFAGELTIRGRQGPRSTTGVTLADVECVIHEESTGPQLAVMFQVAGQSAADAVELHATRDSQSHPPRTHWVLDTGDTTLPCEAFVDQLPGLYWLGDKCTFSGQLRAALSQNGWTGAARGVLNQVDLDRLVTERFALKLSGQARVELHDCKFRDGLLENLTGRVASRGGVIDSQLLERASTHLRLRSRDRLAPETRHRYGELGLSFELDAQSLSIAGDCRSQPKAVLMDKSGPLLQASPEQLNPVMALGDLLGPANTHRVSANWVTQVLFGGLHLPPVVPPEGAIRERPALRIGERQDDSRGPRGTNTLGQR